MVRKSWVTRRLNLDDPNATRMSIASKVLQQRPESGGFLRIIGDRFEFESSDRILAPERTHRDEQLQIAANGIRKNRVGHDLLQLLVGEFAHVYCLASVPHRMVWNDDVLEQRLEHAISPVC